MKALVNNEQHIDLNSRYFFALCVALFSFVHFIFIHNPEPMLSSISAFEWPSVDMMVYFERALNPHFLANDFFTNTSSELNPRSVFGVFVVILTKITDSDYYSVLFFMKAFLKVFLPAMLYLLLSEVNVGFSNDDHSARMTKNALLALFCIFAGTWSSYQIFTLAGWRPLPIWAAPQSLSLFFCICGGWLQLKNTRASITLSLPLLFWGTLLHPVMGLFILVFLGMSQRSLRQTFFATFLATFSVGLAIFILQYYFSDTFQLSNLKFIQYYVVEAYIHRPHYFPGALSGVLWSWQITVTLFASLFLVGGLVSLWLKNFRIPFLASAYFTSYLLAILLQIFFIHHHPSRIVAILGPIRFTQWGYSMIAIVLSASLALYLSKVRGYCLEANSPFLTKTSLFFQTKNFAFCFYLMGFTLVLLSIFWKDNPKKELYARHSEMYKWIQKNTRSTDVFAIPPTVSELFISIPIIAQRPVYYANAIAFSERYLEENTVRKDMIYGSADEWSHFGYYFDFYCNHLDESRVRTAAKAYPLQWLIVSNDCIKSNRFPHFPIKFKDNSISILKVIPI